MLSRELEKTLHRSLAHANQRPHEYATLEHLLLALTEDADAVGVFRGCGIGLETLYRDLLNYVDIELANLVTPGGGVARARRRLSSQNSKIGQRRFRWEIYSDLF
jgi:ATP-dependent Clp protease ATP-binding subunit ClpA